VDLMDIRLYDIPHNQHRYETVGDWKTADGDLTEVVVSTMQPEDYSFLVALHELVEGWLCVKRGITHEEVTAFDEAYEVQRPEGDESEPGDSELAPYRKEHRFATRIERMMAKELGVNWREYDKMVASL